MKQTAVKYVLVDEEGKFLPNTSKKWHSWYKEKLPWVWDLRKARVFNRLCDIKQCVYYSKNVKVVPCYLELTKDYL